MKNISKFFSIACCLFLVGTKLNALCNNPANLDTTFGPQNNGIVFIDFAGAVNNFGNGGILIDNQGRIVVLGTERDNLNNDNFAVARLLPNGILDTTFDGDGKTTIDFNVEDQGTGGIVGDCQGRLIVAGLDDFNDSFAIARLLQNGTLDSSFGIDGKVTTGMDVAGCFGVLLNKEGKIVLFGSSTLGNLIVTQLNTNGSLDTLFGTNGTTQVDFGGTESTFSDFAIDSQGRIVIVGNTTVGGPMPLFFAMARLNANGSLDTSFGTDGKTIIVDIGGQKNALGGVAIISSGKILVSGQTQNHIVIFQLNDNGSLNTSFGNNGSTIIDLGGTQVGNGGIVINPSGKIYIFGEDTPNNFLVAKLLSNGTFDNNFGNAGITLIPLPAEVETFGGGITIDAQGRIVLLGTSKDNPREFTVIRLCGDELPAFIVALREKYMANCQCN